jgi:hypothetical protein
MLKNHLLTKQNSNRKIKKSIYESTKLFLLTLFLVCFMTVQSQTINHKEIRVNQANRKENI